MKYIIYGEKQGRVIDFNNLKEALKFKKQLSRKHDDIYFIVKESHYEKPIVLPNTKDIFIKFLFNLSMFLLIFLDLLLIVSLIVSLICKL